MRVTHIAPTRFGADGLLGGGERYPLELGRALAQRVDCRLVTFGRKPTSYRDARGLEVVVLRTRAELRGHPAHPLGAGLPAATRSSDILHAHQMRSAPSRLTALLATLQRRPIAVTDHGLGGGGWAGLLPRMFDMFLLVSRYSQQTLAAPDAKTRVVFGGVDIDRFHPEDRAREGALFVGRITPHKGIDRLLRALPEGARLTIAGTQGHDPRPPESDYPQLLRALARGRTVSFAGAVSEGSLPALYGSAAVFVLPSVERTCYGRSIAISELLGLSMLEAMACGTPVICSRVGGLPEVVRDGETGYVVDPGDEGALRERLAQLLGDPGTARRMGRSARELVAEHFTWERCAERCLRGYEELLDNGAP